MNARSEPKPGHRGWFALQYPLLDGEPPTPAVRAAAAADFASGISFPLPFNQYPESVMELMVKERKHALRMPFRLSRSAPHGCGPDGFAE